MPRHPRHDCLFQPLRTGTKAPQLIADCIFDGHRLAREIDSADPATPLPYLRERALAGATAR
jgi:hypothetical protein